jgi:DNA-directed RNA polymerase specialized sigma24 family protein
MRAVAPFRRPGARSEPSLAWADRSARLYQELRRPARAMIRRAFRRAFDDDEVEDIYSNAWLGTLRALARRHEGLSDEEIRKYVLAAVANHASKELRRRSRRPTTTLEAVHTVADDGLPPDERAAKLEHGRLTRDLLSTLLPRRRAVMLLRYGWGDRG